MPDEVGATPPIQFDPSVHTSLVAPDHVWAAAGSGRAARHATRHPARCGPIRDARKMRLRPMIGAISRSRLGRMTANRSATH
jgi:hypothetical protein